MLYYFNPYVAQLVGSDAATLFSHIQYWVDYNRKKSSNFVNGKYWTYSTNKELQETFIYMSEQKIKTCIEKLKNAGLIETGHYNDDKWKKNTWFTTTEYGDSFVEYQLPDKLKTTVREGENNLIYNILYKEDTNTDNYTDNYTGNYNLSSSKDDDCGASTTVINEVISEWNLLEDLGVAPVKSMSTSSKRYGMLKKRLKESGKDVVIEAIGNIRNSPFLLGKAGKKPFFITFDWFVKPNNFIKVYEGNYFERGFEPTTKERFESYRDDRE